MAIASVIEKIKTDVAAIRNGEAVRKIKSQADLAQLKTVDTQRKEQIANIRIGAGNLWQKISPKDILHTIRDSAQQGTVTEEQTTDKVLYGPGGRLFYVKSVALEDLPQPLEIPPRPPNDGETFITEGARIEISIEVLGFQERPNVLVRGGKPRENLGRDEVGGEEIILDPQTPDFEKQFTSAIQKAWESRYWRKVSYRSTESYW